MLVRYIFFIDTNKISSLSNQHFLLNIFSEKSVHRVHASEILGCVPINYIKVSSDLV